MLNKIEEHVIEPIVTTLWIGIGVLITCEGIRHIYRKH